MTTQSQTPIVLQPHELADVARTVVDRAQIDRINRRLANAAHLYELASRLWRAAGSTVYAVKYQQEANALREIIAATPGVIVLTDEERAEDHHAFLVRQDCGHDDGTAGASTSDIERVRRDALSGPHAQVSAPRDVRPERATRRA